MNRQELKKLDAVLDQLSAVMKRLYGQTFQKALQIDAVRAAIEKGEEFEWMQHRDALARFEKMLAKLSKDAEWLINKGAIGATKAGAAGARQVINGVSPASKDAADKAERDATQQVLDRHREKSSGGFLSFTEKDKTDRLSDRVWAITDKSKQEMEIIVQNGVKEGKTPHQIAVSVQQYLNEPNKLFRRVRNEQTGKLELSKAAREYHPGPGVYRSSYANAMRLARTEVKAAYMEAERQSYVNDPQVVGIRITKSANHTTKRKGEVVPLNDICDRLAGDYPKGFVFTGWHPQCRCIMTPILRRPKEQKPQIKALPEQFKAWIIQNEQRVMNARITPYFVANNAGLINMQVQHLSPLFRNLLQRQEAAEQQQETAFETPEQQQERKRQEVLEAARLRHEARTPEHIKELQQFRDEHNAKVDQWRRILAAFQNNVVLLPRTNDDYWQEVANLEIMMQ